MQKEKLKGFIIAAHKEKYHIDTNKKALGYPALAREMMLNEYAADKYPEANARIKLALSDGQAILSKMKALFGSGNAPASKFLTCAFVPSAILFPSLWHILSFASLVTMLLYYLLTYCFPFFPVGFDHVIAAETSKATETAAKVEAQKLDDALGYDAPAVGAPGKDCVAWIKNFMGEKMKCGSDGQWEFLDEGFTKTKVKAFNARVQQWKSNPNSTSYLNAYKSFVAALSNAIQILPP